MNKTPGYLSDHACLGGMGLMKQLWSNMNSLKDGTQADLRKVWVEVSLARGFELKDVYEEDMDALGAHSYLVPAELDDVTAGSLAMGLLHCTVPIKYMDMFDYTVIDEVGIELVPDRRADWCGLASEYEGTLWGRPSWSRDGTVDAGWTLQD